MFSEEFSSFMLLKMRDARKICFKRGLYSGAHTTLSWQKKKERRDSWTGWYANSEVNLLDTLLRSRVQEMRDTRPLALTGRTDRITYFGSTRTVYRLFKNTKIKHSSWLWSLISTVFRFLKTVEF